VVILNSMSSPVGARIESSNFVTHAILAAIERSLLHVMWVIFVGVL
jgi:hypothetical protein